jgi:SNF2 family DNA or RNA helicase
MTNNALLDQLEIINNVFKNSLESKGNMVNLQHIRTNLYQHQYTLVKGMHSHVTKMRSGFVWNNQIIRSKIGIIADPPGSGKTLSVLAYISSLPNIGNPVYYQGELTANSNRYFHSNNIEILTDISSTNLIIVPPHLFAQWKEDIERFTTLTCFPVETRRILRNRTTLELLTQSNIVLTTNKTYRFLQDYARTNGIRWKNVFIDEASTIHFTANDPSLEFDFLWLITNNFIPFLFKNIYINPSNLLYLRDRVPLHQECEEWLIEMMQTNTQIRANLVSSAFFKNYLPMTHNARWSIIVRNSASHLQNSYNLPQIDDITIQCRQNYSLTSIRQSTNVILNPERMPNILNGLGVPCYNENEFCSVHEAREQLIKNKIDEDCSICLDEPQNRILATCCMNPFCGSCIIRHMLSSNSCPTCRSYIDVPDLAHFPGENVLLTPGSLMNKHESLLYYIERYLSGSFVIYTPYENTFYQLVPEFDRMNIQIEKIEYTNMNTTVKKFNEGTIKVLFVSNTDMIAGLNLTKATHLIFFCDIPFYETKQLLICSCQRLGRTSPLTILHLVSEDL